MVLNKTNEKSDRLSILFFKQRPEISGVGSGQSVDEKGNAFNMTARGAWCKNNVCSLINCRKMFV